MHKWLAVQNWDRFGMNLNKQKKEKEKEMQLVHHVRALSAKVHHHYISAGPMYKKDSTILFIRKNYPKSICNMLYLVRGAPYATL